VSRERIGRWCASGHKPMRVHAARSAASLHGQVLVGKQTEPGHVPRFEALEKWQNVPYGRAVAFAVPPGACASACWYWNQE